MPGLVKPLKKKKLTLLQKLLESDKTSMSYYELENEYDIKEGLLEAAKVMKDCYIEQRRKFKGRHKKVFDRQFTNPQGDIDDLVEELDEMDKKSDIVLKQLRENYEENDIKLREMLTIKIGNVTIQPPPESRLPPELLEAVAEDEDGENDDDDEEEDGEMIGTEDAVALGRE